MSLRDLQSPPGHYCPNCLCPSCEHWHKVLSADSKRLASIEHQYQERLEKHRQRKASRHELLNMEGLMFWMLIQLYGAAGTGWENCLYRLAEETDMTTAVVRAKYTRMSRLLYERSESAQESAEWYQRLRAAGAVGRVTFEPKPWSSLPNSRFTDLPEFCDVCGHIMPSKRANYKKQPCTFCTREKRLARRR